MNEGMGTPELWLTFNAVVLFLIFVDLQWAKWTGQEGLAPATALKWTALWIALSLVFAGYIHTLGGARASVPWLTAYVIEYALSVDNLFVFLVIFSFFKVTPKAQHRLLYWGVLGAFVLRAGMIGLGTTLVSQFQPLLYVFGGILLYTSWKLLRGGEEDEVDPEKNWVFRAARGILPISEHMNGAYFTTHENGRLMLTPLFLVLLVVESSDLLFAIDSIPAALSISQDPFIIYTANVCAILGLRSLFFAVSALMDKFHYLKIGLGIILGFVGLKLITETAVPQVKHHETLLILVSLGVVAVTLIASIVASMLWPPKAKEEHP